MTNKEIFAAELTRQYAVLFATDPEYASVASRTTPADLAAATTRGLEHGSASKEGRGVRATCRAIGIKCTYRAILAFLVSNGGENA